MIMTKRIRFDSRLVIATLLSALWTGGPAYAVPQQHGLRAPTIQSLDDGAQMAHSRNPRLIQSPRVSVDLRALDDVVQRAHSRGKTQSDAKEAYETRAGMGPEYPAPTLQALDDPAQKAHSRKPGLVNKPHVSPELRQLDDLTQYAHSRR